MHKTEVACLLGTETDPGCGNVAALHVVSVVFEVFLAICNNDTVLGHLESDCSSSFTTSLLWGSEKCHPLPDAPFPRF